MKILVTGANGYLGQGVVKALLDNGHSVVAADFKTNYVDDRAEKMDCDLFSVEDPYTYFGKPDVLLHLAWRDDDFCAQVAAVVGQDEINGIINICSGKPEKLADRVERFIKENGYAIKLKYGAFPDRPYDSKAVWGDNKKITQIMNEKKCTSGNKWSSCRKRPSI